MRRAVLAVCFALGFCSSAQAVTLVTPTGTPVGGPWQQWANESRVPTINTSLPFVPQACALNAGCSSGPPFYGIQPLTHATTRDNLYFELGHQFDWTYLTWADRKHLARIWHAYGHPWLNSPAALVHGYEDGLEADFAGAYDDCAWGQESIGANAIEAFRQTPRIHPRNRKATCRFIRKIGANHA